MGVPYPRDDAVQQTGKVEPCVLEMTGSQVYHVECIVIEILNVKLRSAIRKVILSRFY